MAESDGALAGVRVLDLSQRLSAAFCARLFGDQCADVVLLEDHDGHPTRRLPPLVPSAGGQSFENSAVHAFANLNKRSALIPAGATDRDLLARAADVVVVSELADVDRLQRIVKPTAIFAGVSAYGLTGAHGSAPGNDLTAFSSTGWPLLNGVTGATPLTGVQNSASYLAGVMAYTGAVAVLGAEAVPDVPEFVDVSEAEVLGWLGANGILAAAFGERPAERSEKPGLFNPPVAVRDGHVTITFSRPHFWTETMRALGLEAIAEDPRYHTQVGRAEHGHEVVDEIEERLSRYGRWDLFELLSDAGATAGVVADMADLAASEQLRSRGIIQKTEVAGLAVETLGAPGVMGATPWQVRHRAPTLGEHTEEVLADWQSPR